MAKKKSAFGKLLAFTTTVAAIGGTCYIFRDKIKESSIYKTITDKLSGKNDPDFSDDDFYYDDGTDGFETIPDSTDAGREYTSITINAKEEEPVFTKEETPVTAEKETPAPAEENAPVSTEEDVPVPVEEKETAPGTDDTIPTIHFNTFSTSESESADGYENENLSDFSDDPDVLEEQDKLDF